jgi:hypothetical protein
MGFEGVINIIRLRIKNKELFIIIFSIYLLMN